MTWFSDAFNKEYHLVKSPKHRRLVTLVLGLGGMGSISIFGATIAFKEGNVLSGLYFVSIFGWLAMLSVVESVDLSKRKWARLATLFWICVCLGASVAYWIILGFGEPETGMGEILDYKVTMAGSILMHLYLLVRIYLQMRKDEGAAFLSSNSDASNPVNS